MSSSIFVLLLRRSRSLAAALMLLGAAMPVQATLEGAFNDLMSGVSASYQTPGYYRSQARNIMVGGGVSLNFPTSQVQLFSVTPPSIGAGCSGIDLYFGGFSFVSGEEFSRLIRNIGQAALGYVVQLALKQLCPQCEAVISALQKASQLARKMAVDSCEAGKALGQAIGDRIFPDKASGSEYASKVCSEKSSDIGQEDGFLSAMNSMCNGMDKIGDFFDNLSAPEKKSLSQQSLGVAGNSTWTILEAMGITENRFLAELLISMVGTVSYNQPYKPLLTKKQFIKAFMCGVNGEDGNLASVSDSAWESYCKDAVGADGILNAKMWRCVPSNGDEDMSQCKKMEQVRISDHPDVDSAMGSKGFITLVSDALNDAIEAVESGREMPRLSIKLIQASPIPLYKVVNIAAVYPSVSRGIVESNTLILSFLLTERYFRTIMTDGMNRSKLSDVPINAVKMLLKEMAELPVGVTFDIKQIDNVQTQAMRIVAQVNQINNIMLNQVFSQGLMGNQAFVSSMVSIAAKGKGR